MTGRIEFPLASGGTVVVEGPEASGVGPAGRGGVGRAAATLRDSLSPVIAAASDVIEAFHALPRKPESLEVRFGVALDMKLGAIIAESSAGVHFEVTLRWVPGEDGAGAAPPARLGSETPAASPATTTNPAAVEP